MHALLLLAALCADPDIEAMKRSLEAQIGLYQRMNDLERRVTDLEQKGGDPKAVTSVVTPSTSGSAVGSHSPAAEPPVQKTAVCRCQGSNRGVCFCLQNRVPCKCHVSKGSVWNLNEQGRAVSKTGQYADPRGNATITRRDAPSGSAPGFEVTLRNDGRWYWHDGTKWRYSPSAPVEGTRYSDREAAFVYRGGRMQPASQMAAVIQPSGHWETRRVCHGTWCENVRVWVEH